MVQPADVAAQQLAPMSSRSVPSAWRGPFERARDASKHPLARARQAAAPVRPGRIAPVPLPEEPRTAWQPRVAGGRP
jgi:hypothetical protein